MAEVEQQTIGLRQDLVIRRQELLRARAAEAGAADHLRGADDTFRREALDALNEADATVRLRQQELTIAQDRNRHAVLTG